MQRSLSALLTATLAIPVVGFTNAHLGAQSPPAPMSAWHTLAPEQSGLWQGDDHHPGADFGFHDLDLTPAQRAQIQALQRRAHPDLAALTTRLQTEQEGMQTLIAREATQPADLRVQHQILEDLRQTVSARRFELLLAMREVLTPAQRLRLAAQLDHPQSPASDKRPANADQDTAFSKY